MNEISRLSNVEMEIQLNMIFRMFRKTLRRMHGKMQMDVMICEAQM